MSVNNGRIHRRLAAAVAAAFLIVGPAAALAQQAGKAEAGRVFRAGAATTNITPPLGEPIVGNFTTPAATHVHDELHARCIVLDDGQTKIALAICDNVGIPREVFDAAKQMVHEATGIPVDHLLMSATHTHSATSARSDNMLVHANQLNSYQSFLARRIADGIRQAATNLQPARIGWGAVDVPGQVFNRRWYLKPGNPMPNPFGGQDKVQMNPPAGSPKLDRPAGPTDPQVSFVSIQATSGRPIALLGNYSLHYVGGVPAGHISADYFAVFADKITQLLGADRLDPPFVGILSNGTSGDINNINFPKGAARKPSYVKMREVADEVAEAVYQALPKVRYHDWLPLGAAQSELTLATRKPTPEMLAYVKQVMAKPAGAKPAGPHERAYAERVLQINESPDSITILLQTLRIGDLGIAAIPFEVFAETGLEIKQKSPFKPTFTIELANGSYGYLPTPPQHALGGYETWLGTNRVEVEASTKIVRTLLELFGKLKAAGD